VSRATRRPDARARRAAAWLAAALFAALAPAALAAELRAGFGVAPLPAKDGTPLGGYGGFSSRRATGQLDPPEARALLLEQGELRIAIVSLDVVIARPEIRDALVEEVAPLEIDLLALVATHTHSGPGGYLSGFLAERVTAGEYDPKQAKRLARAAARAIERARTDLAPARIASGATALERARNRRFSDGAHETQLAVLRIDLGEGRLPVAVFSWGAHPTLLSPENHAYSADWPGAARAALEAKGWRSLFLPAALGDQEPAVDLGYRPSQDTERRAVARYGGEIASAVEALAASLAPVADAELTALERWAKPPEVKLRRFCALWWATPLVGSSVDTFLSDRVPFQVVRAGEAELVAVPAEPGAAVGAALRARVPAPRVPFVVAHANDWLGYVVDGPTWDRGSYESCFSFYGRTMSEWLLKQATKSIQALDAREADP